MDRTIFRSAPVIILVLTISLISPSQFLPTINSSHAVQQGGPTAWSPFGPSVKNLLISVHSDFQTMFNAFGSGELDITDWPVQPGDLASYGSNPDFFLSSPTSDFGIFQADINHHAAFLGVQQQTFRTTSPPSLTVIGTPTLGCPVGFGRLIVNLKNLEEGNAVILDPLNKLKATGPVVVSPVKDDPTGGSSTDGTYVLQSPTACSLLAGTYTISTTVYSGSASVFIGSQEIRTVDFKVNYNSPSTLKPSQSGIELRRALAHMLDKQSFLNIGALGGLADYDDLQAAPAQGLSVGGASNSKLPASILQEDCTGSNPSNSVNPHTWVSACNPVSGYNLRSDTIGAGDVWWGADGSLAGVDVGYSGQDDIRAACDHFVRAGFTVANGDCAALAAISVGPTTPACANQSSYTCPRLIPPGGPNQQVEMYIRTHRPRKAFGQAIADTFQLLLGTPNHLTNNVVTKCAVRYGYLSPGAGCTPAYYTITQVFDKVFSSTVLDDWNIYTGGFTLGSTPDHLYALYHSSFAGNLCGGLSEDFPNDYPLYCNPTYDANAAAGQFASNLAEANGFFGNAATTAFRTVATIPVFSLISQFVALNGWNFQPGQHSSLVNILGHGFQTGFWSLMNMRQVPGYDPCAPANAPPNCSSLRPGGGDSSVIRRGFSQDVHKLSPFHALTVWDFEVLLQVFDSMLAVNPLTGGTGQQVVDWMTTSHSSTFSSTEVSCVGSVCVTGTTTQRWYLRNDLKWHDGQPVTPDDVIYSIIAFRDVPSANLQPNVASVSSATLCGGNCVQVKLQQQSPFYELNIGGLPIIPKHVWEPICGIQPSPSSLCADPDFDPMNQGFYIGSGPWLCKNPVDGHIGGTCTRNADGSLGTQDVVLGGRVVLEANENYMRGPRALQSSSLQKASWADRNDDGVVGLLDIADAALNYGVAHPYWNHPIFGVTVGVVDIGEIATIAFYFDHGITKPFSPSVLTGVDPQVDPYRLDLSGSSGPVAYYLGGPRSGSGQVNLSLVILAGTFSPSAFQSSLSTETGVPVGTTSGVAGGLPSLVTLPYTGISPGRYIVRITWNSGEILTQTLVLS